MKFLTWLQGKTVSSGMHFTERADNHGTPDETNYTNWLKAETGLFVPHFVIGFFRGFGRTLT